MRSSFFSFFLSILYTHCLWLILFLFLSCLLIAVQQLQFNCRAISTWLPTPRIFLNIGTIFFCLFSFSLVSNYKIDGFFLPVSSLNKLLLYCKKFYSEEFYSQNRLIVYWRWLNIFNAFRMIDRYSSFFRKAEYSQHIFIKLIVIEGIFEYIRKSWSYPTPFYSKWLLLSVKCFSFVPFSSVRFFLLLLLISVLYIYFPRWIKYSPLWYIFGMLGWAIADEVGVVFL